jgi:hypothetical protein
MASPAKRPTMAYTSIMVPVLASQLRLSSKFKRLNLLSAPSVITIPRCSPVLWIVTSIAVTTAASSTRSVSISSTKPNRYRKAGQLFKHAFTAVWERFSSWRSWLSRNLTSGQEEARGKHITQQYTAWRNTTRG